MHFCKNFLINFTTKNVAILSLQNSILTAPITEANDLEFFPESLETVGEFFVINNADIFGCSRIVTLNEFRSKFWKLKDLNLQTLRFETSLITKIKNNEETHSLFSL